MKTRTFIAINLLDELKNKISAVVKKFQKAGLPIRWVAPENLHLTLKFLGDLDEQEIKEAGERLGKIVADQKSFQINLSQIFIFPKLFNPRCLVIGSGKNNDLERLAQEIDQNIGQPENRPFKTHLTLGRMREGIAYNWSPYNNLEFSAEFKVEAIELMASELTPMGSIYKIMESFKLK